MSLKLVSNYEAYRTSTLKYFGDLPASHFKIVDCLICGSKIHSTLFILESLWIVRCCCGFVYNKRQPTEQTLNEFYNKSEPMKQWAEIKKSDHEMKRQESKFLPAIDYLINQNTKHLVDLGCGNGTFLKLYRQRDGYVELTGVDPNEDALKVARGDEIFTQHMTIDNFCLTNTKFYDAISLFGVLEHLHDPIYALTKIKERLKFGGHVVVCVPNAKSYIVQLLWEKCFTFCPQHLWYFDSDTLRRLFYKVGIKLKEYYTIEPEEVPVLKHINGFDPYNLLPQWASRKYLSEPIKQLMHKQILSFNGGYKIVAIGQKV